MGDPAEKGEGGGPKRGAAAAAPARPGFVRRWMTRLFVVALGIALALGYGFYNAPGADGKPQRKLPWDDVEGFQRYAVDTFTWARAESEKAAIAAKKKIDEIEWSKEADSLWEKAGAIVGGEKASETASSGPDPTPATPAAQVAAGASNAASPAGPKPATPAQASAGGASGDPVAGPGSPPKPGYYDAYKSGYQSYRDGLVHFRSAKGAKSRAKEMKSALDDFQKASSSWQKAQSLRENDPKLEELMTDLNMYIFECRKALKAM